MQKEDIGKEARVCNQTKNQTKPLKNLDAALKEDSSKIFFFFFFKKQGVQMTFFGMVCVTVLYICIVFYANELVDLC